MVLNYKVIAIDLLDGLDNQIMEWVIVQAFNTLVTN